eukprot:TRINITY_DN342_c0_g1_i1.p1 TRINITY_DN342_c0_g1~~TRINITY_DN342_c0_g1_i1.p1  ORF type:complete len:194 (-),score=76.46 TRINITY_DN342_c0_g1_i1:267-794(-)
MAIAMRTMKAASSKAMKGKATKKVAAAMKTAMKGKTMKKKAMKAMKAKRAPKVARGKLAKALVLKGTREKTASGLKAESLMKNKRGKVVSKRKSANGKRAYKRIETWVESVVEARKALHMNGFVAINGKTLQGKALYVKSKALYTSAKSGGDDAEAVAPIAAADPPADEPAGREA